MAINPNNGVLDIINGTLKVSSIDIKQAGGFSTAINTVARNNVLLFDDQKSTTTFMPTAQGGYMSSTGVTRDTTAGYLELGTTSDAGWVYWPLQLPNSWHTEFDMHVTATGGVLTFSLFNTSEPNHTDFTNNDGGYKIVFDNTNNQIVIYWEGSVHKTVSVSLRSNDWQHVNVNYSQGATSVSIAGKVVLTHEFTQNYQEFDSRYVGFSATAGTSHKIRHLRIHNGDKWLYTKTSNASDITYVSGNVGIGSLAPTELLDVHGNVHIAKDLTVDGNLRVSGTTTFIDSTNLVVEDPIIELAKGNTSDTIDAGLIVTRGASNVAIAFRGDEEELAFGYTQSGASGTDVTPIADGGLDVRVYGNLFANNLTTTANVEATYLKGDGSEITQVTLDQVVGYANTTANTIQLTNSDVGLKATGNVEAEYFVGNGSKLTGLVTDLQSVADNGNTSSNTIQFTNATTAFVANSNVGIGTATPSANLHVAGYQYVNDPPTLANSFDHTDAPLTLTHGTATSSTAINDPKPVLHLTRDGTTSQSYGARASFNLSRYENSSTHSRSRLDVALADGTYAESPVMSLRSDGKVGVGTVTPAYTLDVHGSANVGALTATTISGPVSGNASTATALATARAIGGLSFDGTADITLPGVNAPGTQNTSGNATTATTATNQSGGTVNATTIAGQSISLANNIVHTSDTTTSFGFPGTGTIDFFTAGSERMRIASDGKVGIGLTNPTYDLDVRGGLAVSYADGNAMKIDGGGTLRRHYTGSGNNYGAGFHFTSDGIWPTNYAGTYVNNQIDLGTSTYKWKGVYTEYLAAGGSGQTAATFTSSATWQTAVNIANSTVPSNTWSFLLGGSGNNTSSAGVGSLGIYSNNGTGFVMNLNNNGNVGIGTSPQDLLHIYGVGDSTLRVETDTGQAQLLLRAGATTRRACRIDFSRADTGTQYMQIIGDYAQNATDDLTVASSTSGRIMTWLQNGNVGIGTVSPSGKLNIYTGSTSTVGLSLDRHSTGNYRTDIYQNSYGPDFNVGYGTYAPSSILYLKRLSDGAKEVEINGNVGIGLTSPAFPLDVDGVSRSRGVVVNSGFGNNTARPALTSGTTHPSYEIRSLGGNGNVGSTGADDGFLRLRAGGGTSTAQVSYIDLSGYSVYSGNDMRRNIVFGTSGTERMRIKENGNVGIGTTNPDVKFHVEGNPAFDGSTTLRVRCNASQYGRNQLQLIGRYENSNDAWSATGARNALRFLYQTSSGSAYNEAWTIQHFQNGSSNDLGFMSGTNSTPKVVFRGNGNVGIGTTGPDQPLHVRTGTGDNVTNFRIYSGGAWKIERNHANGGWVTVTQGSGYPGLNLGNGSSSQWSVRKWYNNLDFDYNSSTKGYLLSSANVGQIDFTGQHRSFIDDVLHTEYDSLEGLIVSANKNKYFDIDENLTTGANAIQISQSLPLVSVSTKEKDKACFGVISGSEDPDSREYAQGSFVTVVQKQVGDRRAFINSVGEGAIWVTNINGPLESGDYITTSNVAGYGMKQDDDILHNYTVAKITMDCDFEPVTQPIQTIKKELGNVNYWIMTDYLDVSLEEYSNLAEENRRTVTTTQYSNEEGVISPGEYSNLASNVQTTYSEIETVTYQKIEREESTTEREGYTLKVREELTNVLDEHGQLQWEDHPTDTEKAYKIRYLTKEGKITDEANAVHIAAFVGCTYHCG